MGLSCLNCGAGIPTNEGLFFEQVMVCRNCHHIAEGLMARGLQTIHTLRQLLGMSIRQAILTRKLQFHAQRLEEGPEVDFLGELVRAVQEVRMREVQEKTCPSSTSASSTETTVPRVSIAVGQPASDSPEGSTTE